MNTRNYQHNNIFNAVQARSVRNIHELTGKYRILSFKELNLTILQHVSWISTWKKKCILQMGVMFNKVPTLPVSTKGDFVGNIIRMRSAR